MKRGLVIVFLLLFVSILLLSLVSASWLSDLWQKITGKAIVENEYLPVSTSSYSGTTCNRDNIKIEDGKYAGLARTGSNPQVNISNVSVSSCIKVDFGAIKTFNKIKSKVQSVNTTCGDSCSGDSCGTGGTIKLFYSSDGKIWTYAGLIDRTVNLEWKEVSINGQGRYVLMCRGTWGSGRDNNIVDAIKLVYTTEICIDTCPSLGYECGSQLVCGNSVNCGSCSSGYNCEDGKCVAVTQNITCSDSDGGVDYYVKGTLNYGTVEGYHYSFNDTCIGYNNEIVAEYSCSNYSATGYYYNYNEYTCPYGCSNGACLSQQNYKEVDGCSYLSNDVINKMKEVQGLLIDNHTIILKEGEKIHYQDYVVVPGYLLKVTGVKNGTTSYVNDYVKFTDALTGNVLTTVWSSEGVGIISIGGNSYKVSLSGDSSNATEEYIVKLDYPQTTGTDKMTFNNCKIVCTDSDGGVDYYTKGETIGLSPINKLATTTDYCVDLQPGQEAVKEYFCNSDGKTINEDLYNCPSGCSDGACIKGVCDDLISKVKNPSDFESDGVLWETSWNTTYNNIYLVNGNHENATDYYAGWTTYNNEKWYNVYYEISVFDNQNVDLGQYLEDNMGSMACKKESYMASNGKENTIYICNWDILRNQQDLGNYQYSARDILWANKNMLIRMNVYAGQQLTDAEVAKIAAKKTNQFLNDITNNQFKYSEWEYFGIDWPLSNQVGLGLSQCSSDIISNETCNTCWSCKIEPVICPEYGYQNRICIDYCCDSLKKEEQIQCSPGICSGCYVPRWLGSEKWGDNICIPYGTRFRQTLGSQQEPVEEQEKVRLTVNGSEGEYKLEIISSDEAILTLYGKDETAYEYNLTLGQSTIIEIPGWEGDISKLVLTTNFIGEDYVDVTVTATGYQDTPVQIKAYCNYDGRVNQQKSKLPDGTWESCDNNYECESNLCLHGECYDVATMIKESSRIKVIAVQIVCKILNILSPNEYDDCVSQILGKSIPVA